MTASKRPIVLLVEDEQNIANLIRINLDMAGLQPLLAGDGNVAVEVFDHHPVDLVLLDLMLPGKDGWQVLEHMNAKSKGKIPIVITSARTDKADITRSLEMGAIDYVAKPFDPIELVEKIKKLLKKNHSTT